MRLRDYLAIALLIVVAVGTRIFGGETGDHDSPRRPNVQPIEQAEPVRPPPETPRMAGAPLPPESARDPGFIIEIEDKQNTSVGTAFSIHRSGVWVTARHVTDGCDLVALENAKKSLVRVNRIDQQSGTDISVLWTRNGTAPMPVIRPKLRIGENGYSFGFPLGHPGDVHGRVLGRGRMFAQGRYRTEEPVIAWTQIRRDPDRGAYLGGISGGPWVNENGDVVGVHVAGSPRRGRSYSTAPRSLLAAVRSSGNSAGRNIQSKPPRNDLTPQRFKRYGDRLRRDVTVAKVICLVGEKWRRLAQQRRS